MPWLRAAMARLEQEAAAQQRPVPELAPRIVLRPTPEPVTTEDRLAGEGTLAQVTGDLEELAGLGARTVLLDPFGGDPEETRHPEAAWQALATVIAYVGSM